MPDLAYKLEDLEIVGYADTLDEAVVPQVVPPIFHRKEGADEYLLPPFRLSGSQVERAVVGRKIDFESAVHRGQATPLERPLEARPDHELWIDQKLEPHYEPAKKARRSLGKIARQQIRQAHEALAAGLLDDALFHSQAALSADDGSLDAILIKAIVYSRRHQDNRVKALAEIAEAISPGIDLVGKVELSSESERSETPKERAVDEAYEPFSGRTSYVAELSGMTLGSVSDKEVDREMGGVPATSEDPPDEDTSGD